MNFNPQAIQQLKSMMAMLNGNANPGMVLQSLAQSNPQFQQVLQMCQGQNPKDVFYTRCQEMGVNPDDILNLFR